ncbi:DNRLRE domain-containing protein [Streptomyces sp. NPDC048389]|uniref:DNRLRE domain-containing protein n=1 Tax=Streptomyces sp. NPDC048389 TaxID=3154622 RepID=UPI00345174F0
MTAPPPRLLSPFVRTRTRLSFSLGLLLAALVAALLPWWPGGETEPQGTRATKATPAKSGPRDEAAAMALALRSGKQVLVDTATTATNLTWALPDGQLRSRIHALSQRVKQADGTWSAIDTELRRTTEAPGELGIRPVNAPLPVRFSNGSPEVSSNTGRADRSYGRVPLTVRADDEPGAEAGTTVLAEVDIAGHTVAYTWPGALPKPVLDGPRALYPDVLPAVDLLVVAREEGGFGQLLIVKTPEAAEQKELEDITFGLRSATARFEHDGTTGGVQVVDKESGEEIASIPTPFVWDSAGRNPDAPEAPVSVSVATAADVLKLSGLAGIEPGAHQSPMPSRLDGDGTGNALLHLDAAATGVFDNPEVRFPVFVDPTLRSGWKAWTTAYKPYPNTSFYNGTNFNSGTSDARVGHEDETGGTARSFWRMGYSSSLKGAKVTRGVFKVLNNHSWSCDARQFQLKTTGAISSGTTWNKQPSWGTLQEAKSFAHGYGSGCSDEYVQFDVKEAAQKGADAGSSSITLGMHATSENDTKTWRKFRATSATLEVDYNRAPKEPTGGTTTPGGACVPGPGLGRTVGKTDLTLSASATDPDGNLKALRFRFWKTGTAAPAGSLRTPLSNGKATLEIPSESLADGVTYAWDVRAEDTEGAVSSFFPPGTEPCRITVDGDAPPAPDIETEVFKQATDDGMTWATVKFGETGSITFSAQDAATFHYAFEGVGYKVVQATDGRATIPDLKPPHSGPTTLTVYAFDAYGNRSQRTSYTFYLPPGDMPDGPGDTSGDGRPDLLIINAAGELQTLMGGIDGDLYSYLDASYTSDSKLNPAGHWYDPATGKAALIAKHSDTYPGDGATDLFARTPDGGFWLYPGDGYGSFNVDKRLRVRLPSGAPAPSSWTQIKAVGDVTGDKRPDLFLRAGGDYWALTGYTGASFQEATLMNGGAWAGREIVNVADVDLDSTPDLVWRNPANGNMYVRHGKPGPETGSVALVSLTTAAASRDGDVLYGTGWTQANVSAVVGVPDVNGDRVPDMWSRSGTDGKTSVHHASKTGTGPSTLVLGTDWSAIKSFG